MHHMWRPSRWPGATLVKQEHYCLHCDTCVAHDTWCPSCHMPVCPTCGNSAYFVKNGCESHDVKVVVVAARDDIKKPLPTTSRKSFEKMVIVVVEENADAFHV
jgi:hypothetical protein